jgi:SAM-dependent methyltransferase
MNVHYGCGKCAPENWINFDISPTLKLERLPIVGNLFIRKEWGNYPKNVKIGDILKGLPGIEENSCDAVFCSHVLEHLHYYSLQTALNNTYKILKKRGTFRCVVPDMEFFVNHYIANKKRGDKTACHRLVLGTLMADENPPKGFSKKLSKIFGNSKHLWNYDFESLSLELEKAGFKNIRRAVMNDSDNKDFLTVEDYGRFHLCLAIECQK